MIAAQLLQRQRTEVEDEQEGFSNCASGDVFIRGVLLIEALNVTNPVALLLESLDNKLDDTEEELNAQGSFLILLLL